MDLQLFDPILYPPKGCRGKPQIYIILYWSHGSHNLHFRDLKSDHFGGRTLETIKSRTPKYSISGHLLDLPDLGSVALNLDIMSFERV